MRYIRIPELLRLPPILIPSPKSGSNIKPILHHLIKILKVIETLRLKKKVYAGVLNLVYAQIGWHDRINSSFFSNKQKLLPTKNARRFHRPDVYSVFPQSWRKINRNPRSNTTSLHPVQKRPNVLLKLTFEAPSISCLVNYPVREYINI